MRIVVFIASIALFAGVAVGQPYGKADASSPGDEGIQKYLAREAAEMDAQFAEDVKSLKDWEAKRPQYVEEYFYMLGLSPRPEKTDLKATVVRTLEKGDYVVEMVHYQSRPGLYVTGNLYRPAKVKEGEKLPAVLYVCGHSHRGRDGNKVAYQSHGIWFARHGYVCLVIDTLQLGEIAATHHGTYNLQRWWWHSRGYTPAGVEAWNGIRGIDYLISRPEVDGERIAVSGISGGGAATFWIAAADERVKVAVPVSGMADLESYVGNRVINGHCDCMFLYNAKAWPWTRIAGLIAPRAMLFANSDNDPIFPMDANERISNRMERLYSLYGASDRFDTLVSVGGHAYRKDIRQGAYRFINMHLKGNARAVEDSEVDIVSEGNKPGAYPIEPKLLRVFAEDKDLPADQINTKVDESFVAVGKAELPEKAAFEQWKKNLLSQVKATGFSQFPETIAPADRKVELEADGWENRRSEDGFEFRTRIVQNPEGATSVFLVVLNEEDRRELPQWAKRMAEGQAIVLCEPRGVGATRWTTKNPPNYVERSHVLLGRSVDAGRVLDVIAAARTAGSSARFQALARKPVRVAASGGAALWAAYAAALEPSIAELTMVSPPVSHMEKGVPQILNILRVCDVPDVLGLIAPRPLIIVGGDDKTFARTRAAYEAAGATEQFGFAP